MMGVEPALGVGPALAGSRLPAPDPDGASSSAPGAGRSVGELGTGVLDGCCGAGSAKLLAALAELGADAAAEPLGASGSPSALLSVAFDRPASSVQAQAQHESPAKIACLPIRIAICFIVSTFFPLVEWSLRRRRWQPTRLVHPASCARAGPSLSVNRHFRGLSVLLWNGPRDSARPRHLCRHARRPSRH